MDAGDAGKPVERYDRELLLFGPLRDSELELEQVRRYGEDSAGDPDFVSVYGMPPDRWFARGVRLLGRTVVECTGDALARAIADDVADVVAAAARFADRPWLVDPFAGSANTLFWLRRQVSGATGIGFELDPGVFRLTVRNLAAVSADVEVRHADYEEGLASLAIPGDSFVVVVVAPPWGRALDPVRGLDLGLTTPPVPSVLEVVARHLPDNPVLFVVQVPDQVEPSSQAEVTSSFDWSTVRQYDLDARLPAHGVLLGTRGWTPPHGVPLFWE